MSVSSSLVNAVGRAPFPGKHAVKNAYCDGVRAVRDSNAEQVTKSHTKLRGLIGANAIFGTCGAVMAWFNWMILTELPHGPIGEVVAIADVTASSAFAAGHLASAGAQVLIDHRLSKIETRIRQAECEQPPSAMSTALQASPRTPELAPEARPSHELSSLEKIVNTGGHYAFIAAGAATGIQIMAAR